MDNYQPPDHDSLVQSLWTAIFRGTRLRHVGDNDPRAFILKAILWGREVCRVINVDTGEVSLFPWTELEFLDEIETNLP